MLEKLFGSNARVKILRLFLMNQGRSFYLRQIARDLELQINSVRRELDNLEKIGLLEACFDDGKNEGDNEILIFEAEVEDEAPKKKTKESAGQEKKFYRINPDFVLLEEMKALFAKTHLLYKKDFVKKLEKVGTPKLLILSGFFVGNQTSPVDIFYVGKINKSAFVKIVNEIEKEISREINYTIMESKEFRYRRDITDVFLFDILEGKKLIIVNEYGNDIGL